MNHSERRELRKLLADTQDRCDELEVENAALRQERDDVLQALEDANTPTLFRGPMNPSKLHSVRALGRFDSAQFAAVNR